MNKNPNPHNESTHPTSVFSPKQRTTTQSQPSCNYAVKPANPNTQGKESTTPTKVFQR